MWRRHIFVCWWILCISEEMGCSSAAIGDGTCQRSKGTSGATHMFLASGRWAQLKTVEHYIQEVAAQTLVAKLDPLSKHRIHILASASGALLKLLLSSDGWLAKAIDEWKRGGHN